ncbi:MAG: class I SAM-dependent methyltransferase [Deltaproteobacteria bacterium]|nr:class I SAM-dependent methyltransferase [Deltaproteobacteria bacterium]
MGKREHERLKRQAELHQRLAGLYKERYEPLTSRLFHSFWNKEMLAMLKGRPLGVTLDLACGTGILARDLLGAVPIVGLDLSRKMLIQASGYDLRIIGDMGSLPFLSNSFDTVFARGALHHSADIMTALCEARRVLRPGGRLVAAEPRGDFWLVRAARHIMQSLLCKDFDEQDPSFRKAELHGMLKAAGMRLLAIQGFGYAAYAFAGFPDKFDPLSRVPAAKFLTRCLIAMDRQLCRIPVIEGIGLGILFLAVKE